MKIGRIRLFGLIGLVGLVGAGCATTTVITRTEDGGLRIVSPKDVTIEGLEYRDGATVVRVARYSSAANVEAIRAQYDGAGKLVGTGLQFFGAGLTGQTPKAAAPTGGAGGQSAPRTEAVTP